MSLARQALLRASQSTLLADLVTRRGFARRAVRRFMPGEDLDDALDAAQLLAQEQIGTVLTELGENVATTGDIEAVRAHYLGVLERIGRLELPAQVSVKPTHIGLDVDRALCEEVLAALVARAAATGTVVWIDMEGSRYTDATLELFRRARAVHSNVGVCLQAYLRRTAGDLEALMPLAPAIRLVKGAYDEPPDLAFPGKREVDENFFALATRLLERATTDGGAVPVFGTHDMRLIRRIREHAGAVHVPADRYEVHMLYGIRSDEQRTLARQGCRVRVLISYGTAWFPWYMRRLAERPANIWFVVKNLF